MAWFFERPYRNAERQRNDAQSAIASLRKTIPNLAPVRLLSHAITRTFWGKAWCKHLESFSDFETRLTRGRSYVRSGAVAHLDIQPGKVLAKVVGSRLYTVEIEIAPLAPGLWTELQAQCAGQVASLIELLQGNVSTAVMDVMTRRERGLFPTPGQIEFTCTCPDFARMCKHIAATLYGVGARLDDHPELLFKLRGVDPTDLIARAAHTDPTATASTRRRTIATDQLSDIFGVDLDVTPPLAARAPKPRKPTTRKPRTPRRGV